MKLVYIAGPYTGRDYLAIDDNIRNARNAAARLANEGIAYLCPHLNSAHFEVATPKVPPQWWIDMTLELLRRCDAIVVLDFYHDSDGTRGEIKEANARGMPVFHFGKDWLRLKEWYTS